MTSHSRQDDEPREGVVLPSNGEPWIPGRDESPRVTPEEGRPWGQPWGPAGHADPAPVPVPPPTPRLPSYRPTDTLPPHADSHSTQPPGALPLPAVPRGPDEETRLLPPRGAQPPGGDDADPYRAQSPGALPRQQPQPGGDGDDTQLIPPCNATSGGAVRDPESTWQLRRTSPADPAQSAAGQRQAPPPLGIRPGEPGDRQPPAEFDNLFRPHSAAAGTPDTTQRLPAFDQPSVPRRTPPRQPPYGGRRNGRRHAGAGDDAGGGGGRGTRNPVVLGVLGVVGISAAGLFGGYVLGSGDNGDKNEESRSRPTVPADDSQEPGTDTDPAGTQAKELDTLLADSNNSRDTVIRSVENVRKCEKLGKAARDLREAARQRNDLVNRLDELSLDQLPDHERLSTELTKAWKASAAADSYYAAWADQAAGKKGCKKGGARSTGQLARANKASGDATAAKQRAAKLWNPTARTYDLAERRPAQL